MSKPAPRPPFAATRKALADALAEIDGLLPGSVVVRHMRCGKRSCACKADPPALHGPYIQWTRTVARQDRHAGTSAKTARPLPALVRQRPAAQGSRRQARDRLTTRPRDRRPVGYPTSTQTEDRKTRR